MLETILISLVISLLTGVLLVTLNPIMSVKPVAKSGKSLTSTTHSVQVKSKSA